MEVTKEFIEIDGWVFPLSYVSKSMLIWLHALFLRWAKEDDSARNRQWIEGIAEAFQDGLAGKLVGLIVGRHQVIVVFPPDLSTTNRCPARVKPM